MHHHLLNIGKRHSVTHLRIELRKPYSEEQINARNVLLYDRDLLTVLSLETQYDDYEKNMSAQFRLVTD